MSRSRRRGGSVVDRQLVNATPPMGWQYGRRKEPGFGEESRFRKPGECCATCCWGACEHSDDQSRGCTNPEQRRQGDLIASPGSLPQFHAWHWCALYVRDPDQ